MASDTPATVGQYLRWLETDMPACDNCGVVIAGDLIRHAPDCSFVAAIRAEERKAWAERANALWQRAKTCNAEASHIPDSEFKQWLKAWMADALDLLWEMGGRDADIPDDPPQPGYHSHQAPRKDRQ